jgi:glycosyltransferase involved in cell wall biosynthesis
MTDVCLILEGTYPFIMGGVSSWVHSLVGGLTEVNFSLIHLAAGSAERQIRFHLPDNLRQITTVELADYYLPYEQARQIAEDTTLPQAKVYHALSTGFAGLLGVQLKGRLGRPLLLTEHGIYWKEVQEGDGELECGFNVIRGAANGPALAALREHWTTTFKTAAHLTYRSADAIVAVCHANSRLQREQGAEAEKCSVIVNGVDWRRFTMRAPRWHDLRGGRVRIGFVGRVVPLKDVETFILACRILAAEMPGATFHVVGPTDHDGAYYEKCLELARSCELSGRLDFAGELPARRCYELLDVVVLTSLSEGQPLVILEAMSAGRPVVTTDVGGCRELIEGVAGQDDHLGRAGFVTPPRNPRATAEAISTICKDAALARSLSEAGRRRAREVYGLENCLEAYRRLYDRFIRAQGPWN